MKSLNHRSIALVVLLFVFVDRAEAETWSSFSDLLFQSDYVAQYQELRRGEKTVATRLVHSYWSAKGAPTPRFLSKRSWKLEDFNPATDQLVTKFEFRGRGQHLWTVAPTNNAILYPGATAHRTPGEEVACSPAEFHSILLDAAELRKKGEKLAGNLELTVFGKKHKCE